MLQALPEHCPADALVDARQALVRRVVAPTTVDVGAARDRPRREQRDHRRAVAVVRRRATRGEIARTTGTDVHGRGATVGVARQTRADVVLALRGPLTNFGVSEMLSSIVRVPGGLAEALNPSRLLRSR